MLFLTWYLFSIFLRFLFAVLVTIPFKSKEAHFKLSDWSVVISLSISLVENFVFKRMNFKQLIVKIINRVHFKSVLLMPQNNLSYCSLVVEQQQNQQQQNLQQQNQQQQGSKQKGRKKKRTAKAATKQRMQLHKGCLKRSTEGKMHESK